MDGGMRESSRFLTKLQGLLFSAQRFSLSGAGCCGSCLLQLLPPVLPLTVLTASGTTGGLAAPRDQVPAVVRELLSVSLQSQLLSQCTRTQQAAPFLGAPGWMSKPCT